MKKITCLIISVIMLLPNLAFADFHTSDWAREEVVNADKLGLVPDEMKDDELNATITRAEFAGIAVKLLEAYSDGELQSYSGNFADIEGNPYEHYIRCAYYYGITNGTGKTEDGEIVFSPDELIKRQDLATMFARVIKKIEFEYWTLSENEKYPLDISFAPQFDDDGVIDDYAKEAVYYMAKKGIIKGFSSDCILNSGEYVVSTYFQPLGNSTKEQAIAISKRIFYDLSAKSEKDDVEDIDYYSYIGKEFSDIKKEFGEPEYAFSYCHFDYVFYKFGDVSFAFSDVRRFVPVDGSPVYPGEEFYEEPALASKGVLTKVQNIFNAENESLNTEELREFTGLDFNVQEYEGIYSFHSAFDYKIGYRYFIEVVQDGIIHCDDMMFVEKYSYDESVFEE